MKVFRSPRQSPPIRLSRRTALPNACKSANMPDTATIDSHGQLMIGGCRLTDLAKEFGTPLYVVDETTVRNRCQAYINAFRQFHLDTEIVFALKALCTKAIVRIVTSEGLGLDASSGGEIFTAAQAGSDPGRVYFHGNNKPEEELLYALTAGVGQIVVDNLDELSLLERVSTTLRITANILLRVNPNIDVHTHVHIKTGVVDSKFGIPLNQLDRAIKAARKKRHLNLVGLHAHLGSQIFEVGPYVAETQLLLGLVKKYGLRQINIGGGIGIPYLEGEVAPSLEDFARLITKELKGSPEIKLILEPGRSIVGQAGITLYTIGGIKAIPGRKYIFIDGGMSDNPRVILYQARYAAAIANRAGQPKEETVTVAGRFCESGDILLKDVELQRMQRGDVLAVFCTGAYTYSMASNYNRVGRPAMVLVNEGEASTIIRREVLADIVRNDV